MASSVPSHGLGRMPGGVEIIKVRTQSLLGKSEDRMDRQQIHYNEGVGLEASPDATEPVLSGWAGV